MQTKRRAPNPRATVQQVRVILTAPWEAAPGKLAEQTGLTLDVVRKIRRGVSCKNMLPELPRGNFMPRHVGCGGCRYYVARDHGRQPPKCKLGIPEQGSEEFPGNLDGYECSWMQLREDLEDANK